jgi:hypothetical protein
MVERMREVIVQALKKKSEEGRQAVVAHVAADQLKEAREAMLSVAGIEMAIHIVDKKFDFFESEEEEEGRL